MDETNQQLSIRILQLRNRFNDIRCNKNIEELKENIPYKNKGISLGNHQ